MDHSVLGKGVLKIVAVGSRVTCNPPPTDTDEDYLVLVDEDFEYETLIDHGWDLGGSEILDASEMDETNFQSFKNSDSSVNYIITDNEDFFDQFIYASNVSKKLNLLEKRQRVDLFQIILYLNLQGDDPHFKLVQDL